MPDNLPKASPYRTAAAKELGTADAMLDALDAMIDEALTGIEDADKRERYKRAFAGTLVTYARMVSHETKAMVLSDMNKRLAHHSLSIDVDGEVHAED